MENLETKFDAYESIANRCNTPVTNIILVSLINEITKLTEAVRDNKPA